MKKMLIIIIVVLFFENKLFAQNIKLFDNSIIKVEFLKNDSLDFFIVKNNSRLFKAPKGKFKLSNFYGELGNVFKTLTHNKNGVILELEETMIENKSGIAYDYFCNPLIEDGKSKKYSFKEIENFLELVKSIGIVWNDIGSCDNRANETRDSLNVREIVSLKAIAIANEFSEKCYCTKNDSFPIWMYHIANAIHCDDNKYYVLDPYLYPDKPIELKEWETTINCKKTDCEIFELYSNNCRVRQSLIFLNNSIRNNWVVSCFCN